jgi:2-oxoglutarate ferredoxin oxidoreductase subunit delta
MVGKIIIDTERCKGCGLCVAVCPKNCLRIAGGSNSNGFFPAEFEGGDCTACAMCAIMCPEAIIEVQAETNIVEVSRGKKQEREAKKLTVR